MWITHTWMKCWHINFYATRIRIILAFTYEWVCVASHASFVFCFLFLVFCVLGNICHKLPEVLYRLSRLLHIFARNHFSSGEQMPWHYWNFLLFFFAVCCLLFSVFSLQSSVFRPVLFLLMVVYAGQTITHSAAHQFYINPYRNVRYLYHPHVWIFFFIVGCLFPEFLGSQSICIFWHFFSVCSRFFHNISKRISTFAPKCRWKVTFSQFMALFFLINFLCSSVIFG